MQYKFRVETDDVEGEEGSSEDEEEEPWEDEGGEEELEVDEEY